MESHKFDLLVAGSRVVRVDDHDLVVSAVGIHGRFGFGLAWSGNARGSRGPFHSMGEESAGWSRFDWAEHFQPSSPRGVTR